VGVTRRVERVDPRWLQAGCQGTAVRESEVEPKEWVCPCCLRAALEVWNASQDVVCGRVAVGLSC
jgi:hypothetical protein